MCHLSGLEAISMRLSVSFLWKKKPQQNQPSIPILLVTSSGKTEMMVKGESWNPLATSDVIAKKSE